MEFVDQGCFTDAGGKRIQHNRDSKVHVAHIITFETAID